MTEESFSDAEPVPQASVAMWAAQRYAMAQASKAWERDRAEDLMIYDDVRLVVSRAVDEAKADAYRGSETFKMRVHATALFVRGLPMVECALSTAHYGQAAALLRQELETIAALDEMEAGRRRDGRTPNLTGTSVSNFGRLYGQLSELAHVSKYEVNRVLALHGFDEEQGASVIVNYNEEVGRLYFGHHTLFLINVCEKIINIVEEIQEKAWPLENYRKLFSAMLHHHNIGTYSLNQERLAMVQQYAQGDNCSR